VSRCSGVSDRSCPDQRSRGRDVSACRVDRSGPERSSYRSACPKEEPIAALGVVFLALGFFGAFALEELVRTSSPAGSVDVSVLGVSFGARPAETIVLVAVGLAVVATALLLGGAAALRAGRLRKRSKQGKEELARASRLETTERLLEYRVEGLLAQVQELEERKAAIRGELEAEPTTPAATNDVVVIPEVPSRPLERDSAGRAVRSRLDEGRRWR
jgi:hypothetical protein